MTTLCTDCGEELSAVEERLHREHKETPAIRSAISLLSDALLAQNAGDMSKSKRDTRRARKLLLDSQK